MTMETTERPSRPRRTPAWRVRVGLAVFALVCVVFLVLELPPYATLDPARSRVAVRPDYPLHYPLLWAHIMLGSVALLTACLQIWPWLRRRYPAVHRTAGRIYVFGGVVPASIVVLGVTPVSSTGPVSAVGNTALAVLWLTTTVAGWRAARRRRFADHRAWMIRSVALTFSIVVNRAWLVVYLVLFSLFQPISDPATITAAAGASVWTSWVVNLLVAEWWVLRPRRGAGA